MARRIKAQKIEVEVEEALEQALDFDFDDAALEAITDDLGDNLIDLDDLAEQIALATEELAAEAPHPANKASDADSAVVDQSVAEQLFGQKPQREATGGTVRDTLLPSQPKPANDESSTVGLRRSLARKPSSRIYLSTTALSALWAVGGGVLASQISPVGLTSLAAIGSFAASPVGLAVAAGTLAPIVMFWGFAQLTKRSRELQNAVATMADAALRFSNPQKAAEEQALSLGQSVRQEVAAMNEGIERTLSRAVELEALIQGEVHNLERAYAENESRIHNLITELSNEREAILSHADRVQTTIRGTQSQLSSEFGAITSNISVNVESVAKTLAQTLQHQGEELVARLSNAGEGVSDKLAERFLHTAEEIQSKNTQLFDNLEDRFNHVADRFEQNGRNLAQTFNESAVQAEERADEVSLRMQASAERALATFDDKFRQLDDAIVDRSHQSLAEFDEKIAKLGDRASSLTSQFDTITVDAIEAFEKRLAEVDSSLGERSTSIIHSFIARAQSLEENTEKLGSILESRAIQINETLKERTVDIANTFTDGRNTILSAVDGTKQLLIDEVSKIDSSVENVLNERALGFKQQLETARMMISEVIDGESNKIAETVQGQISVLTKHVSEIEHALKHNVQAIDQHARNHVAGIDQRSIAMQEAIAKSFETAKEVLDTQTKNIDVRADALRDSLTVNSSALNEVLADQARVLEERIDRIRELIAQGDLHFGDALSKQVSLVENAVNSNGEVLKSTFSDHLQTLQAHTDLLKNALNQSNGTLLESIDSRIGSFNENLINQGQQISHRATILEQNLSKTLSDVNNTLVEQSNVLGQRSDELKTIVSRNNDEIKQAFYEQTSIIEERTQTMQSALETGVQGVRNALEGSAVSLAGSLRERVVEASTALSEEASKAASIITTSGTQLVDSLGEQINKATALMTTSGVQLVDSLGEQIDKASTLMATSGSHLVGSLGEQVDRAEKAITSAGESVVTAIQSQVHQAETALQQHSTGLSELVSGSVTAMEKSLAERAAFLNSSVEKLDVHLQQQIENVSGHIENFAAHSANNINSEVDKLNGLAQNLSSAAQQTGAALGNLSKHFSEQLNATVSDSEQRIQQKTEELTTAVAKRNADTLQLLTSLKEDFVGTVGSLLDQLDQSANSMQQVSSNLLGSTQELNSNIGTLHNVSQNTFDNIAQMTDKLHSHAQLLVQAVHMLDQSQNAVNASMDDKQEALARLSNGLIEKSEEIGQIIVNYEQLIAHALKRTDDTARRSTASLQENLNELLANATNRFAGATDDIRKSAEDIRNELSRTTQDIQQSIGSMPLQTQESTAAMRNAVSDQIKALQELSVVMQKTAKAASVSQPVKSAPKATPVQQRAVPVSSSYEKTAQTKASGSLKNNRNSWVSDLLARASRDDLRETAGMTQVQSTRTADHVVESLNSLSVDIVRAIDHNAAVELWDHYRRGQRNIYTQRLYTLNGQLTFDKIRQKYAVDGEFRRSVNQYIADFEKLLRDVSRDGGNARTVRQYLTSDTGKVYTMLAHASGRIQ